MSDIFDLDSLQEAGRKLDLLIDYFEKEDDIKWRQKEWHLVAASLDRLFLYCFAFVLATTLFAFGVRINSIYNR